MSPNPHKDQSNQPAGNSRHLSSKWIAVISIAAVLGICGGLIWLLWPWRGAITDPVQRQEFQVWLGSLGIRGWFIFMALQIIQIVIAIIPGEPVELLAGILYGGWGGLASCLAGVWLGEATVFYLVRRFGYPLVSSFFSEDKLKSLPIFKNPNRLEQLTFILFLIPGTPKDILTYAAGLTDINPTRFLVLSTFARIPSIITSVFVGANIRKGNWLASLLLFAAAGLLGLFGLWIHKKIFGSKSNPYDGEKTN